MAGSQENGKSDRSPGSASGEPVQSGYGSRARPDDGSHDGPPRPLPAPDQAQANHPHNRGDRENPPDKKRDDQQSQDPQDEKQNKDDPQDKKEDQQPEKKPFWRRPVLLTVMISVAVVLTVAGIILYLVLRNYEYTDDAYIDGHIIHVAPRVAGRVLSLNVNDNQYVDAGTVVIKIDPATFMVASNQARAAVQQAQAQLDQAQANLLVAQANAQQAHADVTVAQANATNAEEDFRRYERLQPEARTQQQVDLATANQRASAATVIAQQKRADAMDAQVNAAKTAVGAAQASVASANAQLAQAELNLKYTDVTAGQAGYVTRRTVEAGNYVTVGQELLDIVPKDVWVTANYKETQLTYIRPGERVSISVDAYPQHDYRGHVDSIQTGSGAVFSVLPPENATGNFVKIVQRVPVKVIFDEPLDHILAPGESVEATTDVGPARRQEQ